MSVRIRRRPLRRSRKGNILALSAFLMTAMMGFLAFSVDLGFIAYTDARLQNAADAAALAAVMEMNDDAESAVLAAREYASLNVDPSWGEVLPQSGIIFGVWDAQTKTFTANATQPNAVRLVLRRSTANGNPGRLFFAPIFGRSEFDVTVETIAAGPTYNYVSWNTVYVTSSKAISNVVLEFEDGTRQRFEDFEDEFNSSTFAGTGEHEGKAIATCWVKSGTNASHDGPGYGERFDNPSNETTLHGQPASGSKPHVTVSFGCCGAKFTSGATGAYRIVR